jgi:hypothetical protein
MGLKVDPNDSLVLFVFIFALDKVEFAQSDPPRVLQWHFLTVDLIKTIFDQVIEAKLLNSSYDHQILLVAIRTLLI